MKFKIGDRVLLKGIHLDFYLKGGKIIEIGTSNHKRYRIRKKNKTAGCSVVTWVSESEIQIDKGYYRNKKLNGII